VEPVPTIAERHEVGQFGPWFRARPRLAVIVACVLAVAVCGLGYALTASEQRVRQHDDIRRRFEHAVARHREAVEINDALVQRAAVAKWALEAGDEERALAILDQTVGAGQRLVTALLNGDRL
jgi:hypothetical protein